MGGVYSTRHTWHATAVPFTPTNKNNFTKKTEALKNFFKQINMLLLLNHDIQNYWTWKKIFFSGPLRYWVLNRTWDGCLHYGWKICGQKVNSICLINIFLLYDVCYLVEWYIFYLKLKDELNLKTHNWSKCILF